MTNHQIARMRLHNQLLTQQPYEKPHEVVRWLGAAQAQEYAGAKWAIGLRLPKANEDVIEQALNKGSILRTHVLRPTWHFVTAADIRWMLKLTAPRVHAFSAYWYRRLELNDAIFHRSEQVIIKALESGNHLTREELATPLQEAGINTSELRLTHLLFHAELEGIICNGIRRGKQWTYALLDERVFASKPYTHSEALAELTMRYFASRGPATVKDFAWWSGLTVADAKLGIELIKSQLDQEEMNGQNYWFRETQMTPISNTPSIQILPAYDEYIVAYTDRSAVYDENTPNNTASQGNILFNYIIVLNGKVVGTWKRTIKKQKAIISLNLFNQLCTDEAQALNIQLHKYAGFLGLSLDGDS